MHSNTHSAAVQDALASCNSQSVSERPEPESSRVMGLAALTADIRLNRNMVREIRVLHPCQVSTPHEQELLLTETASAHADNLTAVFHIVVINAQ